MSEPPPATEISPLAVRPHFRWAPAWLASVIVHLAILTAGVLVVGRALPPVASEPDRAAAIALVSRNAAQRQYFSEGEAVPAAPAGAPQADAAASAAAPVPDLGAPPLLPGIDLPETSGEVSGGAANTAAPIAAAGGSRRGSVLPAGIDDAEILAADASIPHEQAPTGPTAKLALFGSQAAEGRSFVFVIDRSQSMGGSGLGAIQAAADELKRQIGALSDEQTLQVIAYNQANAFLTGRELIPATADNKARLTGFVADIAAFGQTEHTRALFAALKLKPEVIFLLTDGGEPHPNLADLKAVRDLAAGRTSIHAIHFGRGEADSAAEFLSRLAAENRGSYTYIDMSRR